MVAGLYIASKRGTEEVGRVLREAVEAYLVDAVADVFAVYDGDVDGIAHYRDGQRLGLSCSLDCKGHGRAYRAADYLDRFVAEHVLARGGTNSEDDVAGVHAGLLGWRVFKRRDDHQLALGVVVYLHAHAPE